MVQPYSHALHYDFYAKITEAHEWAVLPPEYLPGTGFVSYFCNDPVCVIFVYDTVGTNWGVMEWLTCDYSFGKEVRNTAITECIEAAKNYANAKKLTLFTSCKGAKLMHRYESAGFIKTDEGMTNFVYKGV